MRLGYLIENIELYALKLILKYKRFDASVIRGATKWKPLLIISLEMRVAVRDIFKDRAKKEDFFLLFSIPRFQTFSYHFSLRGSIDQNKESEQARAYAHAYKRRKRARKKGEGRKGEEEKKREERAACGVWIRR